MKRDMVAGLIFRDKKLLLVHNVKHNGLRIEPPGGKKNEDENWEDAVVREVQEELGVIVKPTSLFGVYDTNSPEGEFSVQMFFCDIVGGELQLREPEKIGDYGWYSYDEILELKSKGLLVPNMCDALEELRVWL